MKKNRFLVLIVVGVVVLSGGGLAWYRHISRREPAKPIADASPPSEVQQLAVCAREARRMLELAMNPVLEDYSKAGLWRTAMKDAAAEFHRSPEQFKDDLTAGADLAQRATLNAATSRDAWMQAGDFALALSRPEDAEVAYGKAAEGLEKDHQAEQWADLQEKLANVRHFQRRSDEALLREDVLSIRARAGGKPAIEALIRLSLAYRMHREMDKAYISAAEAIERTEQQFGLESPELLVPLDVQGVVELRRENERAEKIFRRALKICEQSFGPDHLKTAFRLDRLAVVLNLREKWTESEELSRRALGIFEKARGPEDFLRAKMMGNLGEILRATDRFTEADPVYRQILDIDEKFLPPDDPYIGRDLGELAHVVRHENRAVEAEHLYRGAIEIEEKAQNREAIYAYRVSLADLMIFLHRSAEVQSMLRLLLGEAITLYGEDSAQYRQVLASLRTSLEETGQSTASLPAVPAGSLQNNPAALEGEINELLIRAGNARNAKDYLTAEKLFREAMATMEKRNIPSPLQYATAINNLGLVLNDSGRFTEAERLYLQALEIDTRTFGPEHNTVADGLVNLAVLNKLRGQPEKALPFARRALQIYELNFGKEHPSIVVSLNNLAAILLDLHRGDEAADTQRRVVAIADKIFGPETSEAAIRLSFLGEILEKTQRYAEAEPVLRRLMALSIKDSQKEKPTPRMLASTSKRYTRCLQALGQDQPAIERRVEKLQRGEPVPDL